MCDHITSLPGKLIPHLQVNLLSRVFKCFNRLFLFFSSPRQLTSNKDVALTYKTRDPQVSAPSLNLFTLFICVPSKSNCSIQSYVNDFTLPCFTPFETLTVRTTQLKNNSRGLHVVTVSEVRYDLGPELAHSPSSFSSSILSWSKMGGW